MKRVIFLFVVFLPGLLMAQTDGIWSLEDCVNYALTNNVDIKQQMLNIEMVEADVLQSKLDVLPDFNGYVSHGYNWGRTIDRFSNEFATSRVRSNNLYLSSSVILFNGLQKFNYIKKTELDMLATKYNVDKFMDDVSISIATYYLQILYNRELLSIAEAQLDISLQQVERTKKLVDAGTLAKGDLLLIESQAATEELNVVNVQNSLDISYLELTQLLDLPSPVGFEIEVPDLSGIEVPDAPMSPEQIYEIALGTQPDVKSAELNLESSEKSLAIARGMISPNLYLSASWGTGYSGLNQYGVNPIIIANPLIGTTEGGESVYSIQDYETYESYETVSWADQLNDNSNESVMLNLNIPIFNGWMVRTNISKAKIGIDNAQYSLELVKLRLRKIIQQAYADAVAAVKSYDASEKKVAATDEAFKYAEQKFNVGMINSVEYNESKKDLTLAQAQLLQAKYDFIFKTTVLDFYMGKPLTLSMLR